MSAEVTGQQLDYVCNRRVAGNRGLDIVNHGRLHRSPMRRLMLSRARAKAAKIKSKPMMPDATPSHLPSPVAWWRAIPVAATTTPNTGIVSSKATVSWQDQRFFL